LREDQDHLLVVFETDTGAPTSRLWGTVFATRLDAAAYLQECGALTPVEAAILHRDGLPAPLVVMQTNLPHFKRTVASLFCHSPVMDSA
jgi:hypothetical protein